MHGPVHGRPQGANEKQMIVYSTHLDCNGTDDCDHVETTVDGRTLFLGVVVPDGFFGLDCGLPGDVPHEVFDA